MEVLDKPMINKIISESLNNSMTYSEYRTLMSQMAEHKSTTGADKSEARANYTLLNDRRMRRWDKTIKISETDIKKIRSLAKNTTWLVITESWCGDAAHVIPVVNKVAQLNKNIDLRLVLRDDNLQLMNAFLTNGNQAIPKLIALDNDSKEVSFTYGPRPTDATSMVEDYKSKYGTLTPEFKEELQQWYNKDKGNNILEDLVNLIS